MIASNSFSKGENQDISKLKSPPDNYFEAQNFKLVSDGGSSGYALENTKGTLATLKLPDTIYPIFKIDPQDYVGTLYVQIYGTYPTSPSPEVPANNIAIPNIEFTNAKQLAEALLQDSSVIYHISQGYYTIQYNNNYVVIVSLNYETAPALYGVSASTPLAPPANLSITTLVPKITNPSIIGAINIKDKVGIYSTEGTYTPSTHYADDPANTHTSTGQIWEVTYDENTNTILDLGTNGELVPSKHLKYHHNLNLTNAKKVSGEGRYETEDYRCHYITDNFNVGRIFNIASDNSFAIPLEALSMKPIHFSSVPVIQNISDGGFVKVGRIQYFYQLQSDNGTETSTSAPSNLISLAGSSLTSTYQAYQGGTQGSNSGKAITIKIENLDTNYDRIKVGYILWEAESVAIVRYFFEGSVPPTAEIQLTHSGSETEVSFTLEQYRLLQAQWDIAKGFTQKKNILLAYNTRNIPFDVDVDCRAYRFSTTGLGQEAHLYDKEDTYGNPRYKINSTFNISVNGGAFGGSWADIVEEADLINPYNDENPANPLNGGNWFINSVFKYKSDGVTLGGEGPIVSYEFVHSPTFDCDTLCTGVVQQFGTPLSGVNSSINSSIPTLEYSPTTPTSVGNTYPTPSGLNCSKNPYVSELFQGYAIGEVYRWGVVFFDKKFQPSFTKWIGDIKFPLDSDNANGFYAHDFDSAANHLTKRELGIKFTLDTSQLSQDIKDSISGWSYVRVKRTATTKTRLGTGILNSLSLDSGTWLNNTGVAGEWPFGSGTGQVAGSNFDVLTIDNSHYEYGAFECPNFKFNINNNYIPGDYIRYKGWLGTVMFGGWSNLTSASWDNSGISKYYYRLESAGVTNVQVIDSMLNSPISKNRTILDTGVHFAYPFINMGELVGGGPDYAGWGGYTHLLSAKTSLGTVYKESSVHWNPGFFGYDVGGTAGRPFYRPYVSYERYLSNQYGLQWETRMGQQYIGTGHFQAWDNSVSGSITSEVFGGDTLATHFGFMKFDGNSSRNSDKSGWDDTGASPNGVWQIQFFPCEVDFDLELRQGTHIANKLDYGQTVDHDEYIYNTAYSQQNEALVFLSEPYNFKAIEENPYRIWAAQEKFDGEFPNAWGKWLTNEYLDVEGTFGPINRMILNKDKVFFYQDYAIGLTAIKEQQALNAEGSSALVLGEGTVLQRYDYVSKTTGSKHQWAVVNTPKGNYHFDATLKKLFMLEEAGDQFGLTDLKGLNTKFQRVLQYAVKDLDIPLKNLAIHGEWNPKLSEVYFTILDGRYSNSLLESATKLTLTYNELTQCFDCTNHFGATLPHPTMYHRVENHLLAIAARTDGAYSKTMFEIGEGLYNYYFNQLVPSSLTFIVNGSNSKENWSSITKRFDLMEFITEVKDSSGLDVPLETIDSIRVYNDYQDTGVVALTPQGPNPGSIKRHLRSWRVNYFRDAVTNLPFLKDKAFFVTITFSNVDSNGNPLNHRLVLHDILTQLTPQQF